LSSAFRGYHPPNKQGGGEARRREGEAKP